MTATAVAVREHPILFSGEMVRAILDGRKTQTRRAMRPQPEPWASGWSWENGKGSVERGGFGIATGDAGEFARWVTWHGEKRGSPYGKPGDRLWVRETWAQVPALAGCEHRPHATSYAGVRYRATWDRAHANGWKPSIHMPRWASRLTLEITGVRVERVQDITPQDCEAEGVRAYEGDIPLRAQRLPVVGHAFAHLWDGLNAARGYGWDANPWVWVLEFRPVSTTAPVTSNRNGPATGAETPREPDTEVQR